MTLGIIMAASALSALASGKILWPTPDMYPAKSWQQGKQGQTTLRVMKDAGETSIDCQVVKSAGDTDLDDAACALALPRIAALTGARKSMIVKVKWYIPTTSERSDFGGAVPFAPIEWLTPSDIGLNTSSPPGAGRTRIDFDVGSDGSVVGCEVTSSSGNTRIDKLFCKLMMQRAAFLPPLSDDGKAMGTKGRTSMRWSISH